MSKLNPESTYDAVEDAIGLSKQNDTSTWDDLITNSSRAEDSAESDDADEEDASQEPLHLAALIRFRK